MIISGYFSGLLRPPPVPGAGHPGGHPGPPPGLGGVGPPPPSPSPAARPGVLPSLPGYPAPGRNILFFAGNLLHLPVQGDLFYCFHSIYEL